jgi:DNA-binding CsgD family transcriptional regulator
VDEETARREHAYREREKELDGLYQLAALFSRRVEDTQSLLTDTAEIVRDSMQYAEIATVSIVVDELTVVASPASGMSSTATIDQHRVAHTYDGDRQVVIHVAYLQLPSPNAGSLSIERREKRLIESAARLLANVLLRREAMIALEKKNIALREVLHQIERDKADALRDVSATLETLVLPYVHELSRSADLQSPERRTVAVLEAELRQLINQDLRRGISAMRTLTPREAEIAGLIRNGLSTKEIAEVLNIAVPTVQRHRNTIRKKLGLRRTGTSMTSYLRFTDLTTM